MTRQQRTSKTPTSSVSTSERRDYYSGLFSEGYDEQWEQAPGKTVVVTALRHFMDEKRIPTEAVMVDVGCGTGFLLNRIHREVRGNRFCLYGVDFSPEAIDKARSRYPFEFFCEDGARMHFPAASVDVCIAYGSLEHFPDPGHGILEISRILKSAGLFLCMMPSLGVDRVDRSDEGWYDERPVKGSPILQKQWNLFRQTWEAYFSAAGLELFAMEQSKDFGAHKPGVFFFGMKS